jgi:ankyrin repeat protein
MWACRHSYTDIVELLLLADADINIQRIIKPKNGLNWFYGDTYETASSLTKSENIRRLLIDTESNNNYILK